MNHNNDQTHNKINSPAAPSRRHFLQSTVSFGLVAALPDTVYAKPMPNIRHLDSKSFGALGEKKPSIPRLSSGLLIPLIIMAVVLFIYQLESI